MVLPIGQLAEPGISRVRSFALIVAVVNCIKNATKRSKPKFNQIFNTGDLILYWLIANMGRKSQISRVSGLELELYCQEHINIAAWGTVGDEWFYIMWLLADLQVCWESSQMVVHREPASVAAPDKQCRVC